MTLYDDVQCLIGSVWLTARRNNKKRIHTVSTRTLFPFSFSIYRKERKKKRIVLYDTHRCGPYVERWGE